MENVNGLLLDVTMSGTVPHVTVRLADGTVVMDTDKLSVSGLQNAAKALREAAAITESRLLHANL